MLLKLAYVLATALLLTVASTPAIAQNMDAGLGFLIGLPQNEFRENTNETGYGLSGSFGAFLGSSPVMIGVDLGYLNYGTERRHEPFSDTIPDVRVEVRTTNNILMLHGFARIQQQQGRVRPYVEGLWGFKYLFTRTSIRDDDFDEPIASSTNFDDFAESWGLGAGVDFALWSSPQRRGRRGSVSLLLNLSARYLWGSDADYLKRGSIRRDPDGGVTYFVLHSRTDMLIPQAALRVRF